MHHRNLIVYQTTRRHVPEYCTLYVLTQSREEVLVFEGSLADTLLTVISVRTVSTLHTRFPYSFCRPTTSIQLDYLCSSMAI